VWSSFARGALASLPFRLPKRRSVAVDLAVLAVLAAVMAISHGARIATNWSQLQWEDFAFFRHVDNDLHGVIDVVVQGSFWKGLYRPLSTNAVYYLDVRWFHRDPRFLHVLAAGSYLFNGYLLYRVGARIAGVPTGALAAAIWLSRTANCEVVLYGCQLQSLLPATFTLLAILIAIEPDQLSWWDTVLLSLCTLAALASKESAVVTCVVVGLARLTARDRRERPLRVVVSSALPALAVTGLWFLWAIHRLRIADSPYWTYDFKPRSLGASAVFYCLTFFNFSLGDAKLAEPCIKASAFPNLMYEANALGWQLALTAAAIGALMVLAMPTRGSKFRVASFGLLWSLLALAPTLPLGERWLVYYGYQAHAGLSLCVACVVSWALPLAFDEVLGSVADNDSPVAIARSPSVGVPAPRWSEALVAEASPSSPRLPG
jgi:hypothetical protein